MRINAVLAKPVMTEKTVTLGENGRYVFKVNLGATKHAVAKAVAEAFGVEVTGVKTVIVPGKKRRIKGTPRFTKARKWKKAIVELKEGQKIKLFTEGK